MYKYWRAHRDDPIFMQHDREKSARARKRIKDSVFAVYGGYICACCHEAEPIFLTLDHVDGGGKKHKRAIGKQGKNFYYWLKREGYPKGYQVLCHNCNHGRFLNGGTCPHKVNALL